MSLESILRRDHAVVGAGLAGVTALAWLHLLHMARHMDGAALASAVAGGAIAPLPGLRDLALSFLMWAVMMVGMMVPAAAPMLLVFATIHRQRAVSGAAPVPTGLFLAGYLVIWGAFSLVAALAQWGLQSAAVLSPRTLAATPVLGGALLIVAGLYQFTRLKYVCLSRCRSPLGFVLTEWREGMRGAFVMGIRHGAFCVGCCWALMALLFGAGVMNLLWVAALAAFVFIEKLIPDGQLVRWSAGAGLLAWGLWVLARSA